MGRSGIVAAALVAVGAVAMAPAFTDAVNEVNFSAMKYGTYASTAMEQLPLIVAVFAVVFIGAQVSRA